MAKKKQTESERIRIQLVRSLIGSNDRQRATVRGLGLRKVRQIVEREDTPAVRGMVTSVPHLVRIVAS
jgi:large subunit ribosomal protein L30